MPDVRVMNLAPSGGWWSNRGLIYLNLCLGLSLITSYTHGYDEAIGNSLQIIPAWQKYFNHPTSNILGLIISAQSVGTLAALPIVPFLCDQLGRRNTLLSGALLMLWGIALQVTSTDLAQFILSRGLIGFGLCFSTSASPLLIVELAHPMQRARLTSSYNAFCYVGSITVAWITFGTFRIPTAWSWILPSLFQALSPVLQVLLIWLTPESPRWLISKGRDREAVEILAAYHANGNIKDPLIQHEYMEIKDALATEEKAKKASTYASLFTNSQNFKRMRIIIALGFFSQWSGNGLVSHYISIILDDLGIDKVEAKTTINGCLQIFNLAMALGAALFVERIGRRKLFLASNAGMFLAFSVWAAFIVLRTEKGYLWTQKASVALMFIFFGFYNIAYMPLLVTYCLEILPFEIRAKGFSVMNLTVSVALALNQYVNPVALARFGWKFYLVQVSPD
ncbi:general substrate transporter [Cantharellus anzutake]|uniref:general substrate transporter n=1 Tax=Cantharellus anzutake TaxID=1750568 RepID=UPI0019046B1F|nr:general substrate transporter [Cantharellus anzutake]KAF8339835.1 general substrate transporter [Cantharellus anzutake]